MQTAAAAAKQQMRDALEDDMNTAVAMAAIFDLVREVNTAADQNALKAGGIPAIQEALRQFDEIFDVLRDDDDAKMRTVLAWGKAMGRLNAEQLAQLENALSDADIERLIEERNQAKRARDFARSDAVRDQLAKANVILEDTKDGVRWKRK